MSVSVSKTLLFPTLANVKFSDLRSSFKQSTSGVIRASELKRITSTSDTNPIVPDAVENANVSTANNLRLSQFQNTIKFYNLDQAGTDLNLNLSAQTWNSNLSKNIVKKVNINGTCGSNSTTAALLFDALVYNLQIIVNGVVLGAGGGAGTGGGGGAGLDAMSLVSSGGAISVLTTASAAVYGGGGGGAKGAQGGFGGQGTCSYFDSYVTGSACNSCPGCNPGYSQNCYRIGGCGRKNRLSNNQSTCSGTFYFNTGNPPGGAGGDGGNGQGYNQGRGDGSGGAGGSPSDCGGAAVVDTQYGGTGETGGNGGDWGSDGGGTSVYGGGASGRAIRGSNYIIDPNSITTAFRGPR
jgi:hypothetical protein